MSCACEAAIDTDGRRFVLVHNLPQAPRRWTLCLQSRCSGWNGIRASLPLGRQMELNNASFKRLEGSLTYHSERRRGGVPKRIMDCHTCTHQAKKTVFGYPK